LVEALEDVCCSPRDGDVLEQAVLYHNGSGVPCIFCTFSWNPREDLREIPTGDPGGKLAKSGLGPGAVELWEYGERAVVE
jgi:hypothetical protein